MEKYEIVVATKKMYDEEKKVDETKERNQV